MAAPTRRPAGWFARHAATAPDAVFVVAGDVVLTYADVAARVAALADRLAPARGRAVGVLGDAVDRIVGLLAADTVDARVVLLPSEDDALAEALDLAALTRGGDVRLRAGGPVAPGVVIFTSGTTGTPRGALHDWDRVAARVRVKDALAGQAWLLPYSLRAFAGVQVFLHALFNGGSVIVHTGSPAEAAVLAARHGVRFLTGTPTFFRFLLATAPPHVLDALDVTQVTIGGEAVEQGLLDQLARRFPGARIGHIYASTELGALFSVHDGRAGFPAAWLGEALGPGLALDVRDGALWVRSTRAMTGYVSGGRDVSAHGWFPTGDHVVVEGDRVRFLGRDSERLNVGGAKVYPLEVEAALLDVPGVRAVRVGGVASSLAGQLVVAEVVAEAGLDTGALKKALLAHARAVLAPHMVPRRVQFVERLDQNESGKIQRGGS